MSDVGSLANLRHLFLFFSETLKGLYIHKITGVFFLGETSEKFSIPTPLQSRKQDRGTDQSFINFCS